MQLEIDDEYASGIVYNYLKDTKDYLEEALESGEEHIFSRDLEEERDEISKLLEAMHLVMDWFK